LVEHPVPMVPSPKFQLQISGATPPEVVAIKLTVCPVLAGFGLAVMADTARLALTTNDWAADVPVLPAESVTVTMTENVPAEVYACVTGSPVTGAEPSPKFQLKLT
jgi:hypothetical protein